MDVPGPNSARASARTVLVLDLLVVCWVVAWVGMGVWIAIDVRQLARLADTLGQSARALRQISDAAAGLADLPLVGGSLAGAAKSAAETAASASRNAAVAGGSIRQLAYLLGIVVVVIPSVPTLAAYLPYRIRRFRQVRQVRTALAGRSGDAVLRRYLATRALSNLTLRELVAVSDDPWRDVEEGRLDVLAAAELSRLGLDPHRILPEPAPGVTEPTG